eukprot:scaffold6456_cov98-Isochrysis_galbana.AAC.6
MCCCPHEATVPNDERRGAFRHVQAQQALSIHSSPAGTRPRRCGSWRQEGCLPVAVVHPYTHAEGRWRLLGPRADADDAPVAV